MISPWNFLWLYTWYSDKTSWESIFSTPRGPEVFFVKHPPLLVAFGLGYFLLACVWSFLARNETNMVVSSNPFQMRSDLRIYQLYQHKVTKFLYKGPKKSSHTERENLLYQKNCFSFRKMCFFSGEGGGCSPTGHSIQLFGWLSSWHKGRRAGGSVGKADPKKLPRKIYGVEYNYSKLCTR